MNDEREKASKKQRLPWWLRHLTPAALLFGWLPVVLLLMFLASYLRRVARRSCRHCYDEREVADLAAAKRQIAELRRR